MDNHQRPYQPVTVDMIGVESGVERFTKDGITNMPPVARWRNNLTALSQYENLFFIASGHCVAVYQPEFPYQTLHRHPALLIRPDVANKFALGFMSHHRDAREEHFINHLIVGDLGSQEVLLLATDSGNVEAYYTSSILSAILEINHNDIEGSYADAGGLRPFFKHWVCQSAWGLSIHKEARMIAVSSNVPNQAQPSFDDIESATITVFAFALTKFTDDGGDGSDLDEDEDMLDPDWTIWNTDQNTERPERDKNYKVFLRGDNGHLENIPNISFVNTPEDSDGIWLLSTDISGIMKLWQIWRGQCLRQWDFSNEDSMLNPWAHASYPGWNVAALDVSIFRPAKTNAEFVGADRAPVHYGYHDRGLSFNVTSIARQIPENSRVHPSHAISTNPDESSFEDRIFNDQDLTGEGFSANEEDTAEGVQPMQVSTTDDQRMQSDEFNSHIDHLFDPVLEFEFEQEEEESDYLTEDEDESEGEDDISIDGEPQSLSTGNRRIDHLRSKVRPYKLPNVVVPQIAMIHCSNTHIRMLGSPKARYPHVFCANVVRQSIPENILNDVPGVRLQAMDRLNMIQKVPELGILLVASQTGRVAVCSLTRQGDLLGFRVDWVLPTKRQEERGQRPYLCTLIGMAVAPLQGRENTSEEFSHTDERSVLKDGIIDGVKTTFDPNMVVLRHRPTSKERQAQQAGESLDPELEVRSWEKALRDVPAWQATEQSTRYRVMLTYTDLSVLTYEISRGVERDYEA